MSPINQNLQQILRGAQPRNSQGAQGPRQPQRNTETYRQHHPEPTDCVEIGRGLGGLQLCRLPNGRTVSM